MFVRGANAVLVSENAGSGVRSAVGVGVVVGAGLEVGAEGAVDAPAALAGLADAVEGLGTAAPAVAAVSDALAPVPFPVQPPPRIPTTMISTARVQRMPPSIGGPLKRGW